MPRLSLFSIKLYNVHSKSAKMRMTQGRLDHDSNSGHGLLKISSLLTTLIINHGPSLSFATIHYGITTKGEKDLEMTLPNIPWI